MMNDLYYRSAGCCFLKLPLQYMQMCTCVWVHIHPHIYYRILYWVPHQLKSIRACTSNLHSLSKLESLQASFPLVLPRTLNMAVSACWSKWGLEWDALMSHGSHWSWALLHQWISSSHTAAIAPIPVGPVQPWWALMWRNGSERTTRSWIIAPMQHLCSSMCSQELFGPTLCSH